MKIIIFCNPSKAIIKLKNNDIVTIWNAQNLNNRLKKTGKTVTIWQGWLPIKVSLKI